ncbi:glycoside hydrolase family 3 protein [Rhodohalobacter mucosus]|uniref:Glycoside hydrolase family 3 n=1 Tax=Rhodohalobacter mucosus TaxID=2079485 RepID=A0A316TZC4_9BACT|nr:glycoside hydrolase family 3 protein [Rhodohalobacter mucosus]PWN05416.1 glycoside hydrolase family 3 [Rhodohalobacter mucosus]
MNMKYLNRLAGFISVVLLWCSCSEGQDRPDALPDLQTMAGQMVMVGFNGFEISDTSHVTRDITQYHAGGVILFDYHVPGSSPNRNIDSPPQLRKLIADLQGLSEIPLFIAVDQEGGRVARLKPARGFPEHRSAEYLGGLNNPDSTRHYASDMAGTLSDLGFNVNFAPVVDINLNPENPVIGKIGRSFSDSPEVVVQQASIFLEEFNSEGVLGVLKHFPGHGSAWNDSHLGMADVTDTWRESELEPYAGLTDSNLDFAVMTAHVFNSRLDPDWPATLSEEIQTGILRERFGYDGVLFSDDMQMEAIRSFYGLRESIARAVQAGVDVVVFANNSVYDPDVVPKVIDIIVSLVEEGTLTEERIAESYNRIMNQKRELGLIE